LRFPHGIAARYFDGTDDVGAAQPRPGASGITPLRQSTADAIQ